MNRDQALLLTCWAVVVGSAIGVALLVGMGMRSVVESGYGWVIVAWGVLVLGAACAWGYVEEWHKDRD